MLVTLLLLLRVVQAVEVSTTRAKTSFRGQPTHAVASSIATLLLAIPVLLLLLLLLMAGSPSLSRSHPIEGLASLLLLLETLLEDRLGLLVLLLDHLEQVLGHLSGLVDHDLVRTGDVNVHLVLVLPSGVSLDEA